MVQGRCRIDMAYPENHARCKRAEGVGWLASPDAAITLRRQAVNKLAAMSLFIKGESLQS